MLMGLITLTGCRVKKPNDSKVQSQALLDVASKARERGSLEASVPYGIDEEEGINLMVPTLDNALSQYEWVVGEPVEEKTIATGGSGIFTIYRFRIEKRSGKHRHPEDHEERDIIDALPPREGEILVVKSGGNIVVDGVLLKKRGELCFSELMPHRYLLGMTVSSSGRVGALPMGCRSIFGVDQDRLMPRQPGDDPFTRGVREQLGNSLTAFLTAVEKHQQP
jgi:hypothetical protein